jgi:hypothetical protein
MYVKMDRIEKYAAWMSLGADFFLILTIFAYSLLPYKLQVYLHDTTLVIVSAFIAILAGIIGLPRWQAVAGLGLFVLLCIWAFFRMAV